MDPLGLLLQDGMDPHRYVTTVVDGSPCQAQVGGATRRQTGRTATYGGDYGEYDEDDDADYWDIDAELEERSMYCGHTRADYEELLCQGIKPWDVLPGSIPFNDL